MVLGGKLPLYNLSGYNRDSGFRGLGLGLRGWFLMGYSYIHTYIYYIGLDLYYINRLVLLPCWGRLLFVA